MTEWLNFFNQIKDTATASSLRRTPTTIIRKSTITSAQAIWDRFRENFTDDCMNRLDTLGSSINLPIEWSRKDCACDYGLLLLSGFLRDLGRNLTDSGIISPMHN